MSSTTIADVHHVMPSNRWSPTALGLLTLTTVTLFFTVLDIDSPVRLPLTLAAVLTAPGWVVASRLPPMPASLRWSLTIALSLVGSIVISMVMLLTGWWFPVPVFGLYLLAISVLLILQLRPHLDQAAPPLDEPTPSTEDGSRR